VRRPLLVLGIAGAAGLAYAVSRARELAIEQDRPLSEVLADLPRRLPDDLATFFDDLRDSAEEGRAAADRQREWIDDDLAAADEE
jgi:hypothetical protein